MDLQYYDEYVSKMTDADGHKTSFINSIAVGNNVLLKTDVTKTEIKITSVSSANGDVSITGTAVEAGSDEFTYYASKTFNNIITNTTTYPEDDYDIFESSNSQFNGVIEQMKTMIS